MRGEGVGTLRAASEEYTRVIISRESRESHKILLYAFGGVGVSKNLGRCTQRPYISSSHAYYHLVMQNLFNVVQFAHARQSSSKLVSALA